MKGVLRRWLPCLVAAFRIAAAAAEPADGAPVLTVRVDRADALFRQTFTAFMLSTVQDGSSDASADSTAESK